MGNFSKVCGRFAPTPSGRMHLGNVFCALISWLSARSADGKYVLRIEDLDPDRSYPEYASLVEEDLHWLGIDWDEGGTSGGPHGSYFQKERYTYYEMCYSKLQKQQLYYPCFCSRSELHASQAPHLTDGPYRYKGKCHGLSEKEIDAWTSKRKPAIRLIVPDKQFIFHDMNYGECSSCLKDTWGDFIIRRSDSKFSYQFAVVVDDIAMGITEVIRGRDLLESTFCQMYLYNLFGVDPPRFGHVPLLLAPDGSRLSKRNLSLDLGKIREHFAGAEVVIGHLALLSGLIDKYEPLKAKDLIPLFSFDKMPKEDIKLPKLFYV